MSFRSFTRAPRLFVEVGSFSVFNLGSHLLSSWTTRNARWFVSLTLHYRPSLMILEGCGRVTVMQQLLPYSVHLQISASLIFVQAFYHLDSCVLMSSSSGTSGQ